MIIHILYEGTEKTMPENMESVLYEVAEKTARILQIEAEKEISVLLTDNQSIQELNAMYRGLDEPTDVLSFALNEETEEEPFYESKDQILLGDIVISVERAQEQAQEYGHSLEREMGFLLCHGILHLLGYDHMKKDEEKKMFALQEKILQEVHLER